MTRYSPPTIDSFGGIEPYLEATKDEHNGYGADALKLHWNWGKGRHMNITALAIMYGVVWSTMDGWLDKLHADNAIPRTDKIKRGA